MPFVGSDVQFGQAVFEILKAREGLILHGQLRGVSILNTKEVSVPKDSWSPKTHQPATVRKLSSPPHLTMLGTHDASGKLRLRE